MAGVVALIVLIVLIYAISYYIYKKYFYFPPIEIEQLRNKRVIVTGASRGIGEELAYEYSRYNCRLMLAARSVDKLKSPIADKCRELGAKQVECIYFDASKEESCNELIEKTVEIYGGIDILVLNHTAAVYESFFQSSIQENIKNMKHLMDANFYGYFLTTMAALPHLAQSGTVDSPSQVIAVSSLAGASPMPKTTLYGTTKHAIQGFFSNLARELQSTNTYKNRVTSTLVILGLIETEQALSVTHPRIHRFAANVRKTAQVILSAGVYRQARVIYPYHFVTLPPLYYLITPLFELFTRLGN